jgi:hypothetical protein
MGKKSVSYYKFKKTVATLLDATMIDKQEQVEPQVEPRQNLFPKGRRRASFWIGS